MVRFIRKKPNHKIVRTIQRTKMTSSKAKELNNVESVIKDNNNIKEETMADERIEKVNDIIKEKAPKRKVKVEKKDKGLFERTNDSTILLTEDNKMLLTD